jgi:hypothetical protein
VYDPENNEVPRADGSTCPAMGFMLAYNQFSSNSSLRTHAPAPAPFGEAGGLGRRGAQKMVVHMTDGVLNASASASFTTATGQPGRSYYNVRHPTEYPSNSGSTLPQCLGIVDRLCALETANPPGYSTPRIPVLVHSIAFGNLFEPTSTASGKAAALDFLKECEIRGKTHDPATSPLPDYKIIVGTSQERVDKLTNAFTTIMQGSAVAPSTPVTLIE